MNIIDLLAKIESGEIKTGTTVYVDGDFFYNLIVIDKSLYVIQEMTKQLELLESQHIGRFIRDDVELKILKPTAPTINDIRESNGLPRIEQEKECTVESCCEGMEGLSKALLKIRDDMQKYWRKRINEEPTEEDDINIKRDIKYYLIDPEETEKLKIDQINMNFKILRERIYEIEGMINFSDKNELKNY